MMKKIVVLICALSSWQLYAQEVITTSTGEGDGVVWAIGQTVTNTIDGNNADAILTQGFIQPEYAIPGTTGIIEIYHAKIEFTAYPNPVADRLTLSFQDAVYYRWTIYNVSGQKLATGTSDDLVTAIDFSGYAAGEYVLNLTSSRGSRSIKIIK